MTPLSVLAPLPAAQPVTERRITDTLNAVRRTLNSMVGSGPLCDVLADCGALIRDQNREYLALAERVDGLTAAYREFMEA